MSPGYSGTPLARKLGIKDGMRFAALDAPKGYVSWLDGLPASATIVSSLPASPQAVHLFVTERRALAKALTPLRHKLLPAGFVWVSWPKKSSGVATDITEDVIREVALPLGFVDIKVCAVTDVWSGLKLVIRRSERSEPARPSGRRREGGNKP
jgi:hypothetical protein